MGRKTIAIRFRLSHMVRAVRMLSVLAGIAYPTLAVAQLNFNQLPPVPSVTSGGVTPNVIIAVDNSGSMLSIDDGGVTSVPDAACTSGPHCGNTKKESRLYAVQDALNAAFGPTAAFPLTGKIRLAFESYWQDMGFGPNRFFQTNSSDPCYNCLALFDATAQKRFISWVNNLSIPGSTASTPSQWALGYAGEYLKGNWLKPPGAPIAATWNDWLPHAATKSPRILLPDYNEWNSFDSIAHLGYHYSPWRSNVLSTLDTREDSNGKLPNIADPHELPCRRSYFILLTDGAWGSNGVIMPLPINQFFYPSYTTPTNLFVGPGVARRLPDNTLYSPALDPQPGNPGFNNHKNSIYASARSDYMTLADYAFYYWATDLQPKLPNQLAINSSVMPVTADRTVRAYFYNQTNNKILIPGIPPVTYTPYWNPENDPATWQHMQTYIIGFGSQVYSGAALDMSSVPPFDGMYNHYFEDYASHYRSWPLTADAQDMVNAAYNGRGKFYPATSVDALTQALRDILKSAVTAGTAPPLISTATASSGRLTSNTLAYAAHYSYNYDSNHSTYDKTNNWWGVAGNDGITGSIGGWSGSITAFAGNQLDMPQWRARIPATRNIFTAGVTGIGVPFAWSSLSGDPLVKSAGLTPDDAHALAHNPLGDIVDSQMVFVGQPWRLRLDQDYLKFVKTVNGFNGSNAYRNGVLYVGANDGMLHGFDAGQGTSAAAGSGEEKMAYVPRGLLPALHSNTFADANYAHRFWVDGGLSSGEAQLSNPGAGTGSTNNPGNWATVLAGTLGAGGPGYFVLDVTHPDLFSAANASKLVLIDATDTSDPANGGTSPIDPTALPYIGHQFSPPVMEMYTSNQSAQIVQINTQQQQAEWAVIMGNGYNSASGQPVLLIQSLTQKGNNGHLRLYTVPAPCHGVDIDTCKKAGNGLSAPRPIDVDGNGTADIVYAGDLMGNLWKFDISSPNPDQWQVANGTSHAPAPLFTAVGPTGQRQPITTAPAVVPKASRGALEPGFMVVFGTGKNLTEADMTDTNLNSVYGLYDDQKITPLSPTASQVLLSSSSAHSFASCLSGTGENRYRGCLRAHGRGAISQGSTQKTGTGLTVTANRSTRIDSQAIDGPNAKGWYYDIPDVANGNAAKVLDNPMVMPGNTLLFYSRNVLSHTIATGPSNTTETCGSATTTGVPLTTVNFLDLLTGNPASNALNIGNLTYSQPGMDATQANRFQISSVSSFIASGSSLACAGADCMITLNLKPSGKSMHAGWRIDR